LSRYPPPFSPDFFPTMARPPFPGEGRAMLIHKGDFYSFLFRSSSILTFPVAGNLTRLPGLPQVAKRLPLDFCSPRTSGTVGIFLSGARPRRPGRSTRISERSLCALLSASPFFYALTLL